MMCCKASGSDVGGPRTHRRSRFMERGSTWRGRGATASEARLHAPVLEHLVFTRLAHRSNTLSMKPDPRTGVRNSCSKAPTAYQLHAI